MNYNDLYKVKIKQTCNHSIYFCQTYLTLSNMVPLHWLFKRWRFIVERTDVFIRIFSSEYSSQHFILVPSQEFSAQFYFQSTQAYHRLQTESRGHSQEPHSLCLLLSCSLHLCDASRNPICLQKKDMDIQSFNIISLIFYPK